MDTGKISKDIQTQWAGRSIAFFEEIDSTNIMAGALAEQGAPEGTLVLADHQTGGKGRRGRQWFSPAGTGIWMTLLLRPELSPERISAITLVAALSVGKAIHQVTGLDTGIKWPNDLVVDGKKVCGILTEMRFVPGSSPYVLLGIGINVNQTEFPADLPHAYSLRMALEKRGVSDQVGLLERRRDTDRMTITGEDIRERIIAAFCTYFENDYETYLQSGGMRLLKREYEENLTNLNREVQVLAPSGSWLGVAEGISDTGDLLVRDEAGVLQTVNSGEVSVRGVYGYAE